MKITLLKAVKVNDKFLFGDVVVDAKIGKKLIESGAAKAPEKETAKAGKK